MEKFSSLSFDPFQDGHCDVIVEKPTFFMKLDASKLDIKTLDLEVNLQTRDFFLDFESLFN